MEWHVWGHRGAAECAPPPVRPLCWCLTPRLGEDATDPDGGHRLINVSLGTLTPRSSAV